MPESFSAGIEPAPRDKTLWCLAAVTGLVSAASIWYFNRKGFILAYQDAISHMEIARRVVDSPTTGFGQLGGVWLPLPHLLMLPFIWSDLLYYSGMAGSLISAASFVIATLFVYKIVLAWSGRKIAALVGALVLMANPNVLYMQSTPMTELLLLACMSGMAYYVLLWIQHDRDQYLIKAGIAGLIGSLTRYEAWILLAALVAVVILVAWRKGYGREKTEGITLAFLFLAGLGIAGWMSWNQLIFNNALNFFNGPYAKPSLWVGSHEPAVGHWLTALKTYAYATVENLHVTVAALAVMGLLGLLVSRRLGLSTLPIVALLVPFPFFVLALEKGQRPLHVLQINGSLYNIRFGLLMVLPAAVLIGCLVSLFADRRLTELVLAAGVVAIVGVTAAPALKDPANRIVTLSEPLRWQNNVTNTETTAAAYLKEHYRNGRILEQFFGNEDVLFSARIPLTDNIYEGSYRLWQPALGNPLKHGITWIVMHYTDNTDQVMIHLNHSPVLRYYQMVYQNTNYQLYERR